MKSSANLPSKWTIANYSKRACVCMTAILISVFFLWSKSKLHLAGAVHSWRMYLFAVPRAHARVAVGNGFAIEPRWFSIVKGRPLLGPWSECTFITSQRRLPGWFTHTPAPSIYQHRKAQRSESRMSCPYPYIDFILTRRRWVSSGKNWSEKNVRPFRNNFAEYKTEETQDFLSACGQS